MMQLRDYQQAAVTAAKKWCMDLSYDHRRGLIVAPTGAGKSLIISAIASWWCDTHQDDVLIISHRAQILRQNAAKIDETVQYICASIDNDTAPTGRIYMASTQTLQRRGYQAYPDNIGLIIIDEAHAYSNAYAAMYQYYIDRRMAGHQQLRMIGLTATPMRAVMGGAYDTIVAPPHTVDTTSWYYDDLVYHIDMDALIDRGYLVSPVYHSIPRIQPPIMDWVDNFGDWRYDDVYMAMHDDVRIDACCDDFAAHAAGHRWLAYAPTCTTAEDIAYRLSQRGLRCKALSSQQDDNTRDSILADHRSGDISGIVNVDILTTGYDDTTIDTIGLFAPTKSVVRYIQSVGRGLRPNDGKTRCDVYDYGGVILACGLINNPILSSNARHNYYVQGYTCAMCGAVLPPRAQKCPQCGWEKPVLAPLRCVERVKGDTRVSIMSPLMPVDTAPNTDPLGGSAIVLGYTAERHTSLNGHQTLYIEYLLHSKSVHRVSQYLSLNPGSHDYARKRSRDTLLTLVDGHDIGGSVDDGLKALEHYGVIPYKISYQKDDKFWAIKFIESKR